MNFSCKVYYIYNLFFKIALYSIVTWYFIVRLLLVPGKTFNNYFVVIENQPGFIYSPYKGEYVYLSLIEGFVIVSTFV